VFDTPLSVTPSEFHRNISVQKLGWCDCHKVKNVDDMFARLDTVHERESQTDRYCTMHSVARQKVSTKQADFHGAGWSSSQ